MARRGGRNGRVAGSSNVYFRTVVWNNTEDNFLEELCSLEADEMATFISICWSLALLGTLFTQRAAGDSAPDSGIATATFYGGGLQGMPISQCTGSAHARLASGQDADEHGERAVRLSFLLPNHHVMRVIAAIGSSSEDSCAHASEICHFQAEPEDRNEIQNV